ncbi:hypothetical protein Emed_007182 [Eimeria media]
MKEAKQDEEEAGRQRGEKKGEGGKQQHGHNVAEGSRRLHEVEPLSREISKEELHDIVEQIKADMRGEEQKEGKAGGGGGGVHEAARRPHAEEEVLRDLQHAQKATPLSREQSKKASMPLRKRPSAGATIVMEVAPGSAAAKTATAFGTTVHVVTTKRTDSLPSSVDVQGVLTKAIPQHPSSSSTSTSSARPHYTAPGERTASSGSHVPLSRGMSHATNAPTNPPELPSKLGSKK